MNAWYPDRGLATLIAQWRERHPGAVVGTIADQYHEPPSDHIPEEDGSVDAGDFMPGNGVTQEDLDELAETLRVHRDPRIAYVIRRQRIFSSTNTPWVWRSYSGEYHGHTHVSVNDRHENDTSPWEGFDVALTPEEVDAIAGRTVEKLMAHMVTMKDRPDVMVRDLLKQGLPAKEAAEANRETLAGLSPMVAQIRTAVDGIAAGDGQLRVVEFGPETLAALRLLAGVPASE